MNNLISVKELRSSFEHRQLVVEECPGVYRWWFLADEARQLLKVFKQAIDSSGILKREIGGFEYWGLYFGISSNMRRRIRWHIFGPFESSTLRRTLRALLQPQPSIEDEVVNNLLDNCYWEWDYTNSLNEAETIEQQQLSQVSYCYPLNIKDNKSPLIPIGWRKELKERRVSKV